MHETPARATFLATGLFIGGLLAGAAMGRTALERIHAPYTSVDLISRVLQAIEEDYVEPVPTDDLVDAAIEGMVGHLDSQSRWLDNTQLRSLRDDAEGASPGLGIDVAPAADWGVRVVRVADGSPAARKGVEPGDRILRIDGLDLKGLPFGQVEETFEGAHGETATLTVLREGWEAPRTIRTIREQVPTNVIHAELMGDSVAYVHLSQFQQGAADDVFAEVERIAVPVGGISELTGLVVDVRDNPGGLLSEAVAVVDLFLDDGVIVSTRGRPDEDSEETHPATPGGFPPTLATVVLINGLSASASEILAGALQDTKRGVLVGERTYGKGTVQKLYLHRGSQQSALKLTVGRYYTPSGAPVAPSEGRVPDHVVPHPGPEGPRHRLRQRIEAMSLDDADRAELLELVAQLPSDRPRRAAIEWQLPLQERLAVDPQLRTALELLTDDP